MFKKDSLTIFEYKVILDGKYIFVGIEVRLACFIRT